MLAEVLYNILLWVTELVSGESRLSPTTFY